jgi:hypothetical protein
VLTERAGAATDYLHENDQPVGEVEIFHDFQKMSERATCTECGASLLAGTAARTGGICMACKKGIRKSIDEAVAYNKRKQDQKLIADHWMALVKRQISAGLDSLSTAEQIYFAVNELVQEVDNGGFDQYFFNGSGDHFQIALRGLQAFEAWHTHSLLLQAVMVIFGDEEPPIDSVARRRLQVRLTTDNTWKRLDELDHAFYEDRDGLGDKLDSYGRSAGWFT